ncbi:MAG: hypothetical protein AVDCRST_MAG95-3225 [uncultured Adhaeribacter sp.]|uniref:Uncharacterized protein n=1 Tax=uncultured Adhaeribacter sp. TaxID=448109 RepID=A0A6J4JJ76_9BACT|nr:MAG: hypothetical protein AVDCRST_MAG95-3225 [uncultured Adhaeribacter sp.]
MLPYVHLFFYAVALTFQRNPVFGNGYIAQIIVLIYAVGDRKTLLNFTGRRFILLAR